jgi:hypothetical protein
MQANGKSHASAALPGARSPHCPSGRLVGEPQSRSEYAGGDRNVCCYQQSNCDSWVVHPVFWLLYWLSYHCAGECETVNWNKLWRYEMDWNWNNLWRYERDLNCKKPWRYEMAWNWKKLWRYEMNWNCKKPWRYEMAWNWKKLWRYEMDWNWNKLWRYDNGLKGLSSTVTSKDLKNSPLLLLSWDQFRPQLGPSSVHNNTRKRTRRGNKNH